MQLIGNTNAPGIFKLPSRDVYTAGKSNIRKKSKILFFDGIVFTEKWFSKF